MRRVETAGQVARLVGIGLLLSAPVQASVADSSVRAALDLAIQRVYPALVRIHVVTAYYSDGREVKGEASGSGVIISDAGYVITNHHVAGKAKRIRCTLADKEELDATLVGTDALADIAVLKLELKDRKASGPLPAARFGNSDALRVGDEILAMGSPRAISQSVTLGIVSNTEMMFPSMMWPSTFKLDGEETGTLVKWIGHDAQIFPGNSGGPLVNLEGEIVGINEISFGLSGAIPGNLAHEVAEEIVKNGEVRRSWLGLALQPLLKGDEGGHGALVGGIVAGSPAEKAGLKPGDLLLAYDGHAVDVRYSEQIPALNRLLLETPIGTAVELSYERDGKPARAKAVTVARGTAQGDEAELKSWGITVRELTLLAAKELQREPGSGVLVSSLRPGASSSEAKPPLAPGDIIVEVGGKPVKSVAELVARSAEATGKHDAPTPVLVGFERRQQRFLTVVKVGDREGRDQSAEATKAWLPAATQVLTPDLAEALGVKGQTGVRITQVYPDASAAKAGLRVGDLLVKLDGDAIQATQPEDVEIFPAMVRQYPVGSRVKLEGFRDGKPLAVEVELPASPRSTRELSEYDDRQFDFSARDLTFQDRVQRALDVAQDGALVTGVESGGWAALAHMAVGDIVLAIDGLPITSAAALEERMKKLAESRPARVVFFVRRGPQTLFLELEPAWEPA
jgi:serine protease Do